MKEMSFVSDSSTEPDASRSSLDLSLSGSDENIQKNMAPRRKRKGVSATEEEANTKRNLMYEAAIKYMQQPQVTQASMTDEDMFGQYVASQLKLIPDAKIKLNIKARINNLFFMQQMETSSCVPDHFPD